MPAARCASIFGFDDFRPGQAEACAAALAGRDVLVVMPTGAGQVALLPAARRCCATDLTIVVSPLVSLMQDQVEALERVAPGRVALVNAQQDAGGRTARRSSARGAGELRLLYVAPERFSSPGFLERCATRAIGLFVVDEAHCVSQWGHDFRPDYFRLADAARWLGARAIVASTATATPQVAARHRRGASACASRCAWPPASTARTCRFAVVPCRAAARRAPRASPPRSPSPARARRSSTRAPARSAEQARRRRSRGALGVRGRRLPRRPAARRARATAQARFMDGEVDGRRRDQRVRHGRRQGRRADGRPRQRPGVARGLLPGGRPRRARRRARRAPAVRAGARQGPARVLHRARAGRRGRSTASPTALQARRGGRPHRRRRAGGLAAREPDQVRAIVGHLVRAGRAAPAPAPVGPRARALLEARTTGAPARRAARRPADADAGALAPVPLGVGVRRGRRRAAARRSCATSATLATPAPQVPCCDVCAPESVADVRRSRAPAAARARRGERREHPGGGPRATSTRRSSTSSSARQPSVGRTRTVEILRGGRSKVVAKHGYDGLPAYGAFAAPARRRRARARRRAARRGPAASRPAAASRSSRGGVRRVRVVVLASGAGRTSRRSSTPSTAARHRDRRRRLRPAPAAPALERARGGRDPDARSSSRDDHADRTARDVAMADWLRRARRRARRARRATWRCSTPRSCRASPTGSSTSTRRCCPPSRASARSSRRSTTA